MVMLVEEIVAWGHENVRATHRTTLEITKESHLTPRGDCIVGVRADKSIADIDERIKERLREGAMAEVELVLPDYGLKEVVVGYGSPKMTFSHPTDIVIRKSEFVCDRTLLIRANRSAIDLDREMVELLKDPKTELLFVIRVL